MGERTTVVLRSLTNGVHALPIRSNAADPTEREANPGVVLVGIEPTPVLLTEAERLVCEALPGLVEIVPNEADPTESDTEEPSAETTEVKPVWLGDGLNGKPSKAKKK